MINTTWFCHARFIPRNWKQLHHPNTNSNKVILLYIILFIYLFKNGFS